MTAATFPASRGRVVVEALIRTIDDNAMFLSDLDGAIGDGDHGVNMRKGFTQAGHRFTADMDFVACLEILGGTLLTEIGGAMGPLYGTFFEEMARTAHGCEVVDAKLFGQMLDAGVDAVLDVGGAKVGDKTLVDVMVPARDAFHASSIAGGSFAEALANMTSAADQGRDATRDLVARIGRASRLGERSLGVVDAGATSCALLLATFAGAITELLSDSSVEPRPA